MGRALAIMGWVLALPVLLFVLLQVGVAVYLKLHVTATDPAAILQQAQDFAEAHAGTLQQLDLAAVALGLGLGLWGGLGGRLPGTRKASLDQA